MKPKEQWQSKFGDDYLKRNRVDWQARIPFWKMILEKTGARSVFEFGCNAGWNLSAIRRICPDVVTQGGDVHVGSVFQAKSAGLDVYYDKFDPMFPTDIPFYRQCGDADLSFTAGVLIHIPPEDLESTMKQVISKSYDWVLAVEYFAEEETEIEYQGQPELLWKRPYGDIYRWMGLDMVDSGISADGFDNCMWWLLRK